MLNVSTALPTLSPRGTLAPAKVPGGDFQDTLDGLSGVPVADPLLAVSTAKGAAPGLCAIAPATTDIPDTGAAATALTDLIPAAEPTVSPDAGDPAPPVFLLPVLPSKRQALADGGKPLPADVAEDDPSKDVIWPLMSLLQSVTASVAQPLASPKVSPPIVSVVSPALVSAATAMVASVSTATDHVGVVNSPAATPAQAGAHLGEAIAPSLSSPNWAPASAGVVVGDEIPTVSAKTDLLTVSLVAAPKPDLPVRTDTPGTAPAQPVPIQQAQLQPAPAILPASQAFAAAIAAAARQGRDEGEAGEPHAPLALATATLERLHAPAVAATPDARQAALDLRQDSGLQGMIDHIEVLRDGANAGDTRIRLIPDALGAVDVSVRRDGERLHVHFNAENQASARLIADAQPRLAELADARGVKLGQTSVDSGDGQSRQQQPATPIQFTRPASVADTTATPDDLRVA